MWINEYRKMLSGATISHQQIDSALALKEKHLPESIFKFREVSEYSLENLRSNTVWMGSALSYNDPYDCFYTYDTLEIQRHIARRDFDKLIQHRAAQKNLSKKEIEEARLAESPIEFVFEKMLKKDDSYSESDRARIMNILNEAAIHVSEPMLDEVNRRSQTGNKVCSFSTRNDSVVMWGHYAKSHSGFCVEYSLKDLPPTNKVRLCLHPVYYSKKIFDATPYHVQGIIEKDFNSLFGIMAASHKCEDWSYEKEWRLILPLGEGHADFCFQMPKPICIYLGSKMSSEGKGEVSDLAQELQIPVRQMRMSRYEYHLGPED